MASHLETLPTEVQHVIFSYLSLPDLCALSPQSRIIHDSSEDYIRRRQLLAQPRFVYDSRGLQQLASLTGSPMLSSHNIKVMSIGLCIPNFPILLKYRGEPSLYAKAYFMENYKSKQDQTLRRKEVKKAWRDWVSASMTTSSLCLFGKDKNVLVTAMSHLKAAGIAVKLHLYPVPTGYSDCFGSTRLRHSYRASSFDFKDMLHEPEEVRECRTRHVSRPMIDVWHVFYETFRAVVQTDIQILGIETRFPQMYNNRLDARHLDLARLNITRIYASPFKHMEELNLQIDENPGSVFSDHATKAERFTKFLTAMPKLRKLHLEFFRALFVLRDEGSCFITNRFLAQVSLPYLKDFKLGCVEAGGQEIIQFLQRHQPRLEKVEFSHVTVVDGMWNPIFSTISDMSALRSLKLDKVKDVMMWKVSSYQFQKEHNGAKPCAGWHTSICVRGPDMARELETVEKTHRRIDITREPVVSN